MKKILMVLGLIVLALFVVACAPGSQLPSEEGFDSATALAGAGDKVEV